MTKKEAKTFTGKFIWYERLKNSRYGNPKFKVYVYGGIILRVFETSANSSIAYCITNYCTYTVTISYHVLKSGKRILDDINVIDM